MVVGWGLLGGPTSIMASVRLGVLREVKERRVVIYLMMGNMLRVGLLSIDSEALRKYEYLVSYAGT